MAVAALALYVVFIAAGFGWKSYRQWRTTGSTGFRGFHGRPGTREWLAGVGFSAAIAMALLAPLAQLSGVAAALAALDNRPTQAAGTVLAVGGIIATVWAQRAMGESWRVGVDARETTALVSTGVFGWVRNPIFTAMLTFAWLWQHSPCTWSSSPQDSAGRATGSGARPDPPASADSTAALVHANGWQAWDSARQ
ncbi:protein-S-isoprenylcysteine methyltransferase [Mycobacteroides abscessus]|nr:protein-S-isoprenylcysteine methyltransferase [Mycobacteroides abscessus]